METEKTIYYTTKEEAYNAIKIDGRRLKFCSDELKNDYDLCLTAVKNNGLALEFVPSKFKCDTKMILTAVDENSYAMNFIQGNIEDEIFNKIAQIITAKHPDFLDHRDLMYSKSYCDNRWEEKAKKDYMTLKEVEEELKQEEVKQSEDEEEM